MATNGSSPQDDTDSETSSNEETETPDQAPHAGRSVREIVGELWHQRPGPRERTARPASTISTKEIIDGLDRRELTITLIATVLDVLISIASYFNWHHSTNASLRHDASSFLLAGIVGAVLLGLGTAFRRRALLGFAAFIVGFEMISFGDIQGILYIAFGGWLIVRAMRKQKQSQAAGTFTGTVDTGPAKRTATSRPKASKRYTPPRRSRTASAKKR